SSYCRESAPTARRQAYAPTLTKGQSPHRIGGDSTDSSTRPNEFAGIQRHWILLDHLAFQSVRSSHHCLALVNEFHQLPIAKGRDTHRVRASSSSVALPCRTASEAARNQSDISLV